MNEREHDMLIRHDEQLRELSRLSAAIAGLTESIARLNLRLSVSQGNLRTAILTTGAICSVLSAIGTWVVMVFVR